MKARLIVTYKCPRNCEGCCNKDWPYESAKPIQHFNYEILILTGGEPLLFPDKVVQLAQQIKMASGGKVIMYTAMMKGLLDVLPYLDGITLTLHEPADVDEFNVWAFKHDKKLWDSGKSLRLNVFRSAEEGKEIFNTGVFKVKNHIEWLKDCPLPAGEELFELPELL